jgi:hypothetical protein
MSFILSEASEEEFFLSRFGKFLKAKKILEKASFKKLLRA